MGIANIFFTKNVYVYNVIDYIFIIIYNTHTHTYISIENNILDIFAVGKIFFHNSRQVCVFSGI